MADLDLSAAGLERLDERIVRQMVPLQLKQIARPEDALRDDELDESVNTLAMAQAVVRALAARASAPVAALSDDDLLDAVAMLEHHGLTRRELDLTRGEERIVRHTRRILDAHHASERERLTADAHIGVLARAVHDAEQTFERLLDEDAPAQLFGRERAAPQTLAAESARDTARAALRAALATPTEEGGR